MLTYMDFRTPTASTPKSRSVERIEQLSEWLKRHVVPLMDEGRKVQVLLHIKGDMPVDVEFTLRETVS